MGEVSFRLKPLPPFRLDLTAWAIRRRPHNTIDHFDSEIVHDWYAVQQQYHDEWIDLLNRVLREVPGKQLAKTASISERVHQGESGMGTRGHRRGHEIYCCVTGKAL